MKSEQSSDEICRMATDEIKSVPKPGEAGFHREAISPAEGGFYPSARTDLVAKRASQAMLFLLVGVAGIEPASTESKSVALPLGHTPVFS